MAFLIAILIIMIVLVFINILWKKSLHRRAIVALNEAMSIEELKEVRNRYANTTVLPSILYRLANKYQEEDNMNKKGYLKEAEKLYAELLTKYPNHPLYDYFKRASDVLLKNLKWIDAQMSVCLTALKLDTHPMWRTDLIDPRGAMGPIKEPNTEIEIQTAKGTIEIELFDDEAPNTVANFVKLIQQGVYNGQRIASFSPEDSIRPGFKKEGIDFAIPKEITAREAKTGSLVWAGSDQGLNSGAEFYILLTEKPELKGKATIFGEVVSGLDNVVKSLNVKESIQRVTITRSRPSYPEPKRIPRQK
jgi:peptidyl-prolyl cis-trans isomerase B (cyclophilin B)